MPFCPSVSVLPLSRYGKMHNGEPLQHPLEEHVVKELFLMKSSQDSGKYIVVYAIVPGGLREWGTLVEIVDLGMGEE
ncbi:hypothetical protein D9758_006632 [Tetrapyrgos nigripes]|uniref:Uncharacterized protein n=1 Tax=Tetrapyrgos nigripes TaxID=182062 RepID=A0A8H5GJP0_9AGAR|nr:hypothetical protein D9758_006632 [Tetrapyrgos nigripes]